MGPCFQHTRRFVLSRLLVAPSDGQGDEALISRFALLPLPFQARKNTPSSRAFSAPIIPCFSSLGRRLPFPTCFFFFFFLFFFLFLFLSPKKPQPMLTRNNKKTLPDAQRHDETRRRDAIRIRRGSKRRRRRTWRSGWCWWARGRDRGRRGRRRCFRINGYAAGSIGWGLEMRCGRRLVVRELVLGMVRC